MLRPLISKLEISAVLTDNDALALRELRGEFREFGAREDMLPANAALEDVHFLLRGYAFRYKLLGDRRRQITAYLMPGDLCCPDALADEMDGGVASLSPVCMLSVPREALYDFLDGHPGIARALRWASIVDGAIAREWIVNLGQRTAPERLAHLLCETFQRLQMVGLTRGDTCDFPATQAELADTLGLSTVHVNRTLQDLRRDGLITLRGKTLVLHDLPALQRLSDFNPTYLRLGQGHVGTSAAAI